MRPHSNVNKTLSSLLFNSSVLSSSSSAQFPPLPLPFVDILAFIHYFALTTSIHQKPTDSPSYLNFSSHLPTPNSLSHTPTFSTCLCSDNQDFETQPQLMACHFILRGYLPTILYVSLDRARYLDPASTLSPGTRSTLARVLFPLIYHPSNASFSESFGDSPTRPPHTHFSTQSFLLQTSQ